MKDWMSIVPAQSENREKSGTAFILGETNSALDSLEVSRGL